MTYSIVFTHSQERLLYALDWRKQSELVKTTGHHNSKLYYCWLKKLKSWQTKGTSGVFKLAWRAHLKNLWLEVKTCIFKGNKTPWFSCPVSTNPAIRCFIFPATLFSEILMINYCRRKNTHIHTLLPDQQMKGKHSFFYNKPRSVHTGSLGFLWLF